MGIRSPKNDYKFDEKEKYRNRIWSNYAKHLNPSESTVVLMPSSNGLEKLTRTAALFKNGITEVVGFPPSLRIKFIACKLAESIGSLKKSWICRSVFITRESIRGGVFGTAVITGVGLLRGWAYVGS